MNREQILNIVISTVEDLVGTFSEADRIDVNEYTGLFGQNAYIDSLSLVSIIVDLEAVFYEEHKIDLSLTDDRAMTRQISPFTNISTLTDYISELIAEK